MSQVGSLLPSHDVLRGGILFYFISPCRFDVWVPSKWAVRAKQMSMLMSALFYKPLHGKYIILLQSDDVDKPGSARWLWQHLHSESESTEFAIQDQVIATRIYEAKIINKSLSSLMCRVCGQDHNSFVIVLPPIGCLCLLILPQFSSKCSTLAPVKAVLIPTQSQFMVYS